MKGYLKGLIPVLAIAIVGIIVTFTLVVAAAIPLLTLKYHLAIGLKETYHYNNADLALLSLVSGKYNDTYSAYRVLSEHTINGFDWSMQKSLREKLVLLVDTDCFKIVNTTATILRAENCTPAENTGEIFLFKPYSQNDLVEKIILVYS